MHTIILIMFWFFLASIIYTHLGYPVVLMLLKQLIKNKNQNTDDIVLEYPTVTLVIAAHNEEKIIEEKIINTLAIDYPKELLKIVVTSDHSDDQTDSIVKSYFYKGIQLFQVQQRAGKTNAQNECVKTIVSDLIAFSDANSLWEPSALKKLVKCMQLNPNAAYVCGQLKYMQNGCRTMENLYWEYDKWIRQKESNIFSITAGNGSIYLVRRNAYENIDPLYCHDLVFPSLMVKNGYRSLYEKDAVSYEKPGENLADEWSRKTRMAGRTWSFIIKNPNIYNPFQTGFLYSIFMISHRLLRYLLPFNHILLFAANLLMVLSHPDKTAIIFLGLQTVFYMLAIIGLKRKLAAKLLNIPANYCNFIFAYLFGFLYFLRGDIKPYWEKAESTRE